MNSKKAFLIGGRYQVKKKLGAGTMGVVYLATDRLTGNIIALKRVLLGTDLDPVHQQLFLKAIADEFQTLASLRHPNIITVLDYGFDQESPYFTMNYLEASQTFLEAGKSLSTVEQVQLLQQMLEALTYLHRQGILHRDLKPDNVLVSQDVVKVLDFGLASAKGTQVEGGTLFYMAPEVLQGGKITEAVDLYAVGVMAYELFAGQGPFDADSDGFIFDVLTRRPDLSLMEVRFELQEVVGKLLEKEYTHRYATAHEAMVAFSQAIGETVPPEDEAVRESFLQAAQFVGREREMVQLLDTLDASLSGQGGAWLIAGNSGVGKSRLIRELRTQALVQGTLVMTGQAVREGALLYHMWREPLRRLVLLTELTPLQAGVLKPLIPDLPQLLNQEIPDAPELEGEAIQQRLLSVVTALFRQQPHALLLNFEDLQWAGAESLALLHQLMRVMGNVSLMIVGSYRPEERPDLPQALPQAQLMTLPPLGREAMVDLSVSMLGKAGQQPEILDFLQRETEGNAFFLVEIVRTLAEEAGRLSEIGQMVLPATLFPDGIRSVVQRRLAQVPAWAQPLLQVAAIAGRQFDMKVLPALAPTLDIEAWLTTCAKMVVVERQEGQWQLSHDKLREGLLADLTEAERISHHQQVAEAIEQVYPDDVDYAGILTHHWHNAQRPHKERHYARQAGEQAVKAHANEEALIYLNRALELTSLEAESERFDLLDLRAEVYGRLGKREQQAAGIADLALFAQDDRQKITVALQQGWYHNFISDNDSAIEYYEQALSMTRELGDRNREGWCLGYLGRTYLWLGQIERAREYGEQALTLARAVGNRLRESAGLLNLGDAYFLLRQYEEAIAYYEQGGEIVYDMGNRLWESSWLGSLGNVYLSLGQGERAMAYYKQGVAAARDIGNHLDEAILLAGLGYVYHYLLGQSERAVVYYEQGLTILRDVGNRWWEGLLLTTMGDLWVQTGKWEQGMTYLQEAIDLRRSLGNPDMLMESIVTFVFATHHQDQTSPVSFEEVFAYLEVEGNFRAATFPWRNYWMCYQILTAQGDERAMGLLETAYTGLQAEAANITNPDLKRSFLENMPWHREIVAAWERLQGDSGVTLH